MSAGMERIRSSRFMLIAMVTLLGVLLTACGGGDGDEEPTATSAASSAQPTVTSTEASTEGTAVSAIVSMPEKTAPVNTNMSSPKSEGASATATVIVDEGVSSPASTPESAGENDGTAGASGVSTPASGIAAGADTVGTPEGPASDTDPASTPSTEAPQEGTAVAAAGDDSGSGDGTSGAATPASATSGATPAMSASPEAGTTPEASTYDDLLSVLVRVAPPVVDSCEVTDVPPFRSDVTTYVLTADLNFRTGPGSDCDVIGDGPIGEFSAVDIIGGPVAREGDDTAEWVQVQIGDQTGWLSFEFLEPAE